MKKTLSVDQALRKAESLARQGRPEEAAQYYRAVLQSFPQNSQAIRGLAALGQAAVRPQPGVPRDQIMSAVQLYQSGRLPEALAQGRQLAAQYPDDPMIHNFVGVVSSALGDTRAAIPCYQRAIELKPDYAEVYCNLGVAFQQLRQVGEAINHFSRAAQLEPGNANAHRGLADALKEAGRYPEAIAAYNQAIQLAPGDAAAYNNLGNTLMYLGRDEEALPNFARSVELNPGNAETHFNLGHVYSELRRYDEAIGSYRKALDIRPGYDDARAKMILLQAMLFDWESVDAAREQIPALGLSGETVSPFVMLSLQDDPAGQYQRAQRYAREKFGHCSETPARPAPGQRPERLRIGYFSADFHDHATMILMIRMFELHDSDRFAVHAYSFGPVSDDAYAMRIRQAVDVFHDVRHLGEEAIAELARSEGIDIAVDLKGYTQQGRMGIFAYRAAPIQVSYLGYPGTLGMEAMDYVVADRVVLPEAQRDNYSEKVIYLPHSYQVNDCDRQISDTPVSRLEAGLPENGFVFCCFNNSYKITSVEFDIWARLLHQVEGSVLWLLCSNDDAERNLLAQAAQRGLAPERIVLAGKLPNPEHLARHRLADLFLDTFNYNAHTTASDALWAGLPVVTRLGNSFAARVAGSLLNALELPELITDSEEEYEQLALALARGPARLAGLRQKLAAKRLSAPLFDTAGFTRHMEDAYSQAYQRYLDGQAPDTLYVQA